MTLYPMIVHNLLHAQWQGWKGSSWRGNLLNLSATTSGYPHGKQHSNHAQSGRWGGSLRCVPHFILVTYLLGSPGFGATLSIHFLSALRFWSGAAQILLDNSAIIIIWRKSLPTAPDILIIFSRALPLAFACMSQQAVSLHVPKAPFWQLLQMMTWQLPGWRMKIRGEGGVWAKRGVWWELCWSVWHDARV